MERRPFKMIIKPNLYSYIHLKVTPQSTIVGKKETIGKVTIWMKFSEDFQGLYNVSIICVISTGLHKNRD